MKAHNARTTTGRKKEELNLYMDDELADYNEDPLKWWILHKERYPILHQLAFTLLAAPASTAADERVFSTAGNEVNEQRPHTQQELAETRQCLRSWYTEQLI